MTHESQIRPPPHLSGQHGPARARPARASRHDRRAPRRGTVPRQLHSEARTGHDRALPRRPGLRPAAQQAMAVRLRSPRRTNPPHSAQVQFAVAGGLRLRRRVGAAGRLRPPGAHRPEPGRDSAAGMHAGPRVSRSLGRRRANLSVRLPRPDERPRRHGPIGALRPLRVRPSLSAAPDLRAPHRLPIRAPHHPRLDGSVRGRPAERSAAALLGAETAGGVVRPRRRPVQDAQSGRLGGRSSGDGRAAPGAARPTPGCT